MRDRIAAIGGWLVLAVIVAAFASRHGTHWTFGRLGMPEPLVGPSGCYPSGTPVDPVNRALVASGQYQEFAWALALVVAALVVRLFVLIVTTERLRREYHVVLRRDSQPPTPRPR